MIYKESFTIGSQEVFINTLKPISKSNLEEIALLIDSFSKELNHNISGSSAWKFNNAQPNIAIYLQTEFIQYFKYVLKLYLKHPDTFAPFGQVAFKEDMVSFDEEEKACIKSFDFKFDTSFFRNIFIVEYIAEFLIELKFSEFLIEYDNIFIAKGNRGWLIKQKDLSFNLVNSSAYFFYFKVSGFKTHKFGALDNELKNSEALLVCENPAELKLFAPQIQYINTKTDLTSFSNENNIRVIFESN